MSTLTAENIGIPNRAVHATKSGDFYASMPQIKSVECMAGLHGVSREGHAS